MLNDSSQREQAIDPRQSFIVQAPAGSGKTEILTQRYLKLLSTVSAPEQIVALTFTRKAANEMRERILLALQQVALGATASSAHQQKTYSCAQDALTRDKTLGWLLLQQPSRLRIITIDSLCQTLTKAIPLQDKHIHYAQISDKPRSHYLQAARNCLFFAIEQAPYQEAIRTLLEHLDNQQDKLLTLWSDLLSIRDQWLPSLYQAHTQDKQLFEQAITWIEQHELARFRQSLPKDCADELRQLAQELACIENNPDSPRFILTHWESFDELDGRMASGLCQLILTSTNTLRKSFDHHVGLKRGSCADDDYDRLKHASKNLLSVLCELPDFLEALLRIKALPDPTYNPEQWNVLQALLTLLPVLVAHLNLVFSDQNEVDFTAISQQALDALGGDECPTDLALYLDNRIHHILVDEFQDTSIQQYQLLEKLVYGWQPDDGKTLFIVGDPMQSIYRFRAAEVGLFLRAKREGIADVNLIPLELSCNFRSTKTMVNWVNAQFRTIFPARDDIESGAVSFHASSHIKPEQDDSFVKAFQCTTREQEALQTLNIIKHDLDAYPDDNIAILVRSRAQLTDIVRVLKDHQIPFQGVDIDLLANLPHLQDVWSLTKALLMPANRLAWLSLLRSPWCGLSLSDLHCIANVNQSKSIYYALSQLDNIPELTDAGRIRATFIYQVLNTALTQRDQQSLVDWISVTLTQLHLSSVLTSAQQDDLEQFWILLERFEKDGQIFDLALFKDEFNALYSKKTIPSRLQIMTIHKSKGLEFDSVILPGLGSASSKQDKTLLRWLKLPMQQGNLLLLSPIKAAHHEHCALYDYLGTLDSQKNDYEKQRLLYVALTRAKKRLYLLDPNESARQGSFRSLLKNQDFEEVVTDSEIPTETGDDYPTLYYPILYHLPLHFYQNPPDITDHDFTSNLTINMNHSPRLIGIVAHELLQWICDNHPHDMHSIPWELPDHALKTLGFNNHERHIALEMLKKQINNVFDDPKGRWIIKAHDEEKNEYALLTRHDGEVVTRIIDRTFIENGIRWIIDFKTGRDDNKTQSQHKQQVNEYAQLLANQTSTPIHCGLYYLSSGTWIDWVGVKGD